MPKVIDAVRLIGLVTSLRTVIYGVSYLFATKEATNSLLWTYITNLPIIDPMMFGLLLLIVGVVGIFAYWGKSARFVKYTGQVQALCYLFMLVTYIFGGAYFAAIGVAGYLVFMTFLASFLYYNRLEDAQLTSNTK